MKDEGLGLAEGVDHAVHEAQEEGRVEAHRARRVEQDHEAQRLGLAPAPDQIDRRAAMGDAAMDGARAGRAAGRCAAPARRRVSRARMRRASRSASAWAAATSCAGRRYGGRPARERVSRARRRPRAAPSAGCSPVVRLRARSSDVGMPAALSPRTASTRRCGAPGSGAVPRKLGAPHAAPRQKASNSSSKRRQSVGVAAEQRAQRRLATPRGARPAGEASTPSGVAASRPGRRRSRCRARCRTNPASRRRMAGPTPARNAFCWRGAATVPSHATLPRRRSRRLSRVTRARSSWVFSRQISVSCTSSGSCAQIVDAEPGEGRGPVERLGDARHLAQIFLAQIAATIRAICRASARVDARQARQDDRAPRGRRRENRRSGRGNAGAARPTARACRWRSARPAGSSAPRSVPSSGMRDLEIGEKLEQEGLELLVGAVDLVDQQHRRLFAPDRRQQRAVRADSSRRRSAPRLRRHARRCPRAP